MTVRAYAPATVIRRQRQVLQLVKAVIATMPARQLSVLRNDGYGEGGMITFSELSENIDEVLQLKVKR